MLGELPFYFLAGGQSLVDLDMTLQITFWAIFDFVGNARSPVAVVLIMRSRVRSFPFCAPGAGA